MSLNTAHSHGGVLIYSGEWILIFYDGVEMNFTPSDPVPQMKGGKKGRLYLTTHRMIFVNTNANDTLQSFSFPFQTLRGVELEQPVFGANYIKGLVLAEKGGNWNGSSKFKLAFYHGGAIEFGRAMMEAARLASMHSRGPAPPYVAPMGAVYQAPPPAYTPSPAQYGWVPFETFPTAPPAGSVYMTDAPPPYPGVGSYPAAPPPDSSGKGAAFYDPASGNLYGAASAPPFQAPPTYDEATKKNK